MSIASIKFAYCIYVITWLPMGSYAILRALTNVHQLFLVGKYGVFLENVVLSLHFLLLLQYCNFQFVNSGIQFVSWTPPTNRFPKCTYCSLPSESSTLLDSC